MLEVNGSVQFMINFRDLLLFWQDHYLHKDKDCSALEKVTNGRLGTMQLKFITVLTL